MTGPATPPADVVLLRLDGAIAGARLAGFGYLVDRMFVICLTSGRSRVAAVAVMDNDQLFLLCQSSTVGVVVTLAGRQG